MLEAENDAVQMEIRESPKGDQGSGRQQLLIRSWRQSTRKYVDPKAVKGRMFWMRPQTRSNATAWTELNASH